MKNAWWIILALLVACQAESASVRDISPSDFLALTQAADASASEVVILDVRSPKEFESGHVEGAILIPYDQLASRLPELGHETDKPIVVYCESGRRAGMAANVLLESGFTDVRHLAGDMREWRAQGRPLVTP